MKIDLEILNTEYNTEGQEQVGTNQATWYSRRKVYESGVMDDDMKKSTTGLMVDRITLDNVQLTSKKGVEDLMEFLTNAKESFRY